MWILCWLLYGSGHLISVVLPRFAFISWLYPAYNKFMTWSVGINDTYDFDVWSHIE